MVIVAAVTVRPVTLPLTDTVSSSSSSPSFVGVIEICLWASPLLAGIVNVKVAGLALKSSAVAVPVPTVTSTAVSTLRTSPSSVAVTVT